MCNNHYNIITLHEYINLMTQGTTHNERVQPNLKLDVKCNDLHETRVIFFAKS
jgi:hypothetical protein